MKTTVIAAGALMAAAVLAFPAPSQAQAQGDVLGGRDARDARDSRDNRYGYDDAYRIGYDRGTQDGRDRGTRSRSRDTSRDLIHDPKYRAGDAGYQKSYGSRQEYIAGYRDGYEQAVRRGYRTADDGRVRSGSRDGRYGREQGDRNDPYGYGRDGRYGRDQDDQLGNGRDDRSDDHDDPFAHERTDRRDRNDDYDDDVIYEDPPRQ